MIALISSCASIFSGRAFSTFRTLPRRGRIAWKRRSRPSLALPPADGPSTRYSSRTSGVRSEQSASFPGRTLSSREALLDDEIAGLARRVAGALSRQALFDDAAGVGRVLLEPGGEFFIKKGFL